MFSFSSKETHDSQACAGVRFTVRILNEIQRARRDAKLLETRARINELRDQWAAAKDKGTSLDMIKIDDEASLLSQSVVVPAFIRAGMISVDGLEIDGAPATVEALIESGPANLVSEIYEACVRASGLNQEESKNSPSPGTSEGPEAGQETSTTVPAVEP